MVWAVRVRSAALIWLRIEINLFSFTCLLLLESCSVWLRIKYLIIQRIASIIILIRLRFGRANFTWFFIEIGLALKVAVAPFHLWFVRIFYHRTWKIALMLRRSQKLLPLRLIMVFKGSLTYFLVVLNLGVRVWAALKRVKIKKLLSYSSLLTFSWAYLSTRFWGMVYLVVYALRLALFFLCRKENELHFSSIVKRWELSKGFVVRILRLGGVPPIARFWIKIIIILSFLQDWVRVFSVLLARACFLYFYFQFGWRIFCDFSRRPNFVLTLEKKSVVLLRIVLLRGLVAILWCSSIGVKHEKIWPF